MARPASTSGSSGRHRERSLTTDSDLARLAAAYEHRPADDFALTRALELAQQAGVGPRAVALDVGGGPGEHAARWAAETGATAVVVDPSPDMNRRSRRAFPDLPVVRAEAERLPFRDGVARLVYFNLSIHHTVWRDALAEAARVVEPGGIVAVMTLGPDHHERSMLQRWFPRVAELDAARFPDPDELVSHLRELGATVGMTRSAQVKRRRTGDWVAAVRARFVSTLQLLTDEELAAGLDRIAGAHPDDDAPLEYEMLWDEITARFS